MLSPLYRQLLRRWFSAPRRPQDRRPRPVALLLELLETRTVPSVTVVPQQLSAAPNTPTTFNQSQLVNGDTDGTAAVMASAPTQPANATLVDNHNGSYTFTPTNGFSGSTSFTFTAAAVAQQAELTATDGAAFNEFGNSVALDGTTAVIGAVDHTVGGKTDQGAAYVFVNTSGTWTLQAELTAADGAAFDFFGQSVSVSGDTAVVGAYNHTVAGNNSQGTAYVFTRSGTTWSQQAELTATDGTANDEFGFSVSVSGNTAVVGAQNKTISGHADQGAAYAFVRTGTTWTQQAELTASDGNPNDEFGQAVSVSDSIALIGAPNHVINGNAGQGAAYVFVQSGVTWSQQAELTAADGTTFDQFGGSVSVSGSTAVVGADGHKVGSNVDQGAAYVFANTGGSTWAQQAELTATDGTAFDFFGKSVSVSGTTAVVGADLKMVNGHVDQGAAYVFTSAGSWAQQAEFTAADGAASDLFGISVAVSGTTLLAGADDKTIGGNAGQGAAYVGTLDTAPGSATVTVGGLNPSITANNFSAATPENTPTTLNVLSHASDAQGVPLTVTSTTTPANATLVDNHNGTFTFTPNNGFTGSTTFNYTVGAATPQTELTAADGAAFDEFGISVSVSGNTAVIGAQDKTVNGHVAQGVAYVFVRSGSAWTLQQELSAADGAADDFFGNSVSVNGDTAVIGAFEKTVAGHAAQGTAYVFVRSGTTWSQQAELTASDGAASDLFGASVSLSGDTAVIGADGHNANQGSAYVFVRAGTTWNQQQELTAADGAANDFFGNSVSVSGNTAVVGADEHTVAANAQQGAAYVFVRAGTTWNQQQELTAADGAGADNFGNSVSVSGTTALIGADLKSIGGHATQGAAYVFLQSGVTWSQQAELTASDGAAGDNFGKSVSLSGDTAVVGADLKMVNGHVAQGAAYEFTRSGTTWSQQAELTSADGAANDNFGNAVAVSGDTALIGADLKTVNGNADQGAAYAQELGSASATVTVMVNAPVVVAPTTPTLPAGTVGTAYAGPTFTATGGSGSGYTFAETGALPAGLSFNMTTDQITGTPTASGTFPNIVITATDSAGETGSQSYSLTVNPTGTTSAPAITSANTTTFVVGTAGTFTATATGTPTPTVTETGALPGGVTFNAGVLSGTPAAGTAGSYPITLTASNGVTPNATQNFTLVVSNTGTAPAFTSANTATFVVGTAGTFTATATGTPTPTVTETGALPGGVTFNAGVLSGTPAAGTAGSYPITLTASNGVTPNATQNFTLVVSNTGTAPAFTSANTATFVVGKAGTFTATATGTPTPTVTETGALPGGVTFNAGVLSGTPAAGTAGSYPITLTASNGVTPNATQNFTLVVSNTGTAPTFTSLGTTTFTTTEPVNFTVTTTGTPTPTVTETGALPNGVTFNATTGVFSGAPLPGTNGTYPITLTASNGVTPNATQSFVLTVNSPIDELGAYRASAGSWSLDSDGTMGFSATDQVFFSFSPKNVVGVAGDWTGSGTSKIGDFSNGVWHLDLNNNGVVDPGETFTFGQAGDQPVVGDWNGDGKSDLGVFRAAPDGITGEFILDTNEDHILDAGDTTFTFGLATDRIVIGDWNGAGKDEVGVFRDAKSFIPGDAGDAVFSLDTNGNHTFDSGDQVFVFGLITDGLIVGDWNGGGKTLIGVYRDASTAPAGNPLHAPGTGLFSLDSNGDGQFDAGDAVFLFGLSSDQFVAGHWAHTPPLQPVGTPQAQFAANGHGSGGAALTQAQLAPVLDQAIAAWMADGASATQLEAAQVQIGTLDDNLVGETSGNQITLDATADGWGWNTDSSSADFTSTGADGLQAAPGSAAAGKMDLLTVVEHELGHELGLSDVDPTTHPTSLMASTLPTGTRRTIGG